ncbi:MAG: hypothetical protein QOH23_1694 [Gaiellaceae bacterium]|nr:hypothetical protein [Gaiellaceae bacterium]
MKLAALVFAAAAALLLALPSVAIGPAQEVNIEFSDYRPDQLDVLPGETVSWANVSERTHTVTSDTGLFDSGDVLGGARFAFTFPTVGTYRYHCTIHPSITGEIDVRRVTLNGLPTAALAVGTKVTFDGRTADASTPVLVQRRESGSAFKTVATATPAADGSWKATVAASATGDYRALSGSEPSELRRLVVQTSRVAIHATKTGIHVTVAPNSPYSRFLVEIYRRERFGWWPSASGRVNYVSEADVRISRPARVRVLLVDRDGWTALATSNVLVLPSG